MHVHVDIHIHACIYTSIYIHMYVCVYIFVGVSLLKRRMVAYVYLSVGFASGTQPMQKTTPLSNAGKEALWPPLAS